MTSCEFHEKRATKPKFVAQTRPALYFSQHLSSTRKKCFCCGPSWSRKVKNGKHRRRHIHSYFSWTFLSKGERCMRFSPMLSTKPEGTTERTATIPGNFTPYENLQRNNAARQVEGFCISYFVPYSKVQTKSKTATRGVCILWTSQFSWNEAHAQPNFARNSWWRVRHNVMWELDLCCDHKIFLCSFILLFFYTLIVCLLYTSDAADE